MEKKILPYLIVIAALSVSISAAFYSVTGIGKMFAGHAVPVMIAMGVLETAKLIVASMIYQYWSKFSLLLKSYFTFALLVLMAITSAGIYGYLSSAYSETSNKVENIDKKVAVLDLKRERFQAQISDYKSEKDRLNADITQLTNALSNNIIQYKDKDGHILSTTSAGNRTAFEKQLTSDQKRRDDISSKEAIVTDSISGIDMAKLDLQTNAGIAQEVGPLKYIAKLTGKSMDVVVNWFIVALMLVFDPLAVSLIIGANIVFKDMSNEKDKLEELKKVDAKLADFKKKELEFKNLTADFDKRNLDVKAREQEIDDRMSALKIEEFRIEEERQRMLKTHEDAINKKMEASSIKHDAESEAKKIHQQREELEIESFRLIELKKDLERRELENKEKAEELESLNNEIKSWEQNNWKMRRRNPPPSAIS